MEFYVLVIQYTEKQPFKQPSDTSNRKIDIKLK